MNKYTVSVQSRLATTNDVNDGFGDFPNYVWADHTVEADTEQKAINKVAKVLGRKLRGSAIAKQND